MGESDTIILHEKPAKIILTSGSNGFIGIFNVVIDSTAVRYTCIDCIPSSLYILNRIAAKDANAGRTNYVTCEGMCTFVEGIFCSPST